MNLNVDLQDIRTTQFGIGRSNQDSAAFSVVPSGDDVQKALQAMVNSTVQELEKNIGSRAVFDPADKHGSREHLYIATKDDLATPLRALQEAENLTIDSNVLRDMSTVFCYFVRITDNRGRRLTGVRRSAQFKALKQRQMLRFIDDALHMETRPMFQLNDDFDVIMDSEVVHILHPVGFRVLAHVDHTLHTSVRRNISTISSGISFADWDNVERYAERKPRAAALLASIRTHGFHNGIEQRLLIELCKNTGVKVTQVEGRIQVPDASILDFLEVLDRRRYGIKVVEDSVEQYKAASRTRISRPSAH